MWKDGLKVIILFIKRNKEEEILKIRLARESLKIFVWLNINAR
jgi:hypothetical protein